MILGAVGGAVVLRDGGRHLDTDTMSPENWRISSTTHHRRIAVEVGSAAP